MLKLSGLLSAHVHPHYQLGHVWHRAVHRELAMRKPSLFAVGDGYQHHILFRWLVLVSKEIKFSVSETFSVYLRAALRWHTAVLYTLLQFTSAKRVPTKRNRENAQQHVLGNASPQFTETRFGHVYTPSHLLAPVAHSSRDAASYSCAQKNIST